MHISKTRYLTILTGFLAIFSVLLAAGFFSTASAQSLARVNQYIATPFLATWNDIAMTGDTFRYNKTDQGWGTITMPFDFPYDDSIIPAGSTMRIGAGGAISLSSDTTPIGPALDSSDHPGLVCIFSSFAVAGTGHAIPADSDYYEVDGNEPNRVLTVEYHFVHFPGTGSGSGSGGVGGNAAMMQVKFHETTGVIEFIYQIHSSAFEMNIPGIDTIMFGGVGLNGFRKPSFVSNTYKTNLIATPDSDVRWTPVPPLDDSIVVTQPLSPITCMPGTDTSTITVTNKGTIPISYRASIAAPNQSDFIILPPDTSPLESVGGIATFRVVFDPSKNAEEMADFIVTGDLGGSIVLSASGGAAVIVGTGIAPMTLVGQTSAPFLLMVHNTGTCPWTSGIPIVSPQFTYVSGAGTIEPGDSAPFVFTYVPTSETPSIYPVTFPGASIAASTNVNITAAIDAVQPDVSSGGFSLNQNYPNPFNETSNIEITLPVASLVHLAIIDVQGHVVETLLHQHYDAGSFEVTLDASQLASGTYYYQMTAGNVTLTRQMLLMK